jgi:hypothetical protein
LKGNSSGKANIIFVLQRKTIILQNCSIIVAVANYLVCFKSLLRKIRKYFSLDAAVDYIYKDLEVSAMAYFKIPTLLDWDVFEGITLGIKNNMNENNNFDAGLGVFFRPEGIIDVVRIYDEELNLEDVKFIRKKYLEEIARLQ